MMLSASMWAQEVLRMTEPHNLTFSLGGVCKVPLPAVPAVPFRRGQAGYQQEWIGESLVG